MPLPPVVPGVTATLISASPAVTEVIVGEPGVVNGVALTLAGDTVLPATLIAETVQL